jgi:hypothetical protein
MGFQYNIQVMRKRLKVVLFIGVFLWANSCLAATKAAVVINDEYLKKTLAQLGNPRILTSEDIMDDQERKEYMNMGYSFVVKGDFNKDGTVDYAIAGKYDGPYPNQSIFITIISIKDDKANVEFLHRFAFPHDAVFLRVESGDEINARNIGKRFDILIVAMTLWSDYSFVIVWDGTKYVMNRPN